MKRLEERNLEGRNSPRSYDDGRLNFLDLLIVVGRRWRLIGLGTALSLVLGFLYYHAGSPYYTATATIMPPTQQSSATVLLGQTNALSSLAGPTSSLFSSPADLYVSVLQSRTIADGIIASFHLATVYHSKTLVDARAALKAHVDIKTAKDGLIQISVTDTDPRLASSIANGYVSQLQTLNSGLAVTEAAQRRVFFDERLEVERKALIVAEDELLGTEQRNGLIEVSGQAEMVIQTIAQLRNSIANRQVELQSLKTYATDQNQEVIRLHQELDTMQQQLTKLEDDQHRRAEPGNITLPAGQVPKDSLEYTRKLREVNRHETLYDLLSRQYEGAIIDEAKSAPIIQVIDHALPPDKKAGPKLLLEMLVFFVLGVLLSTMLVFAEYGYRRLKQVPAQAARLHELRSLFSLRSR